MMLHLRQLRTDRGLTQDQLSEMTGLSKGFLSQLETGARQPSVESLSILSSALKVSEAELLTSGGFNEPGPMSMARRVLNSLDAKPEARQEPDFKLGTDGKLVQIIATVDREGLDRLIRQLKLMKEFLNA
jgi:transcriptional regulator with XRE-family HTH domain